MVAVYASAFISNLFAFFPPFQTSFLFLPMRGISVIPPYTTLQNPDNHHQTKCGEYYSLRQHESEALWSRSGGRVVVGGGEIGGEREAEECLVEEGSDGGRRSDGVGRWAETAAAELEQENGVGENETDELKVKE